MADLDKPPYLHMLDFAQEHGLVVTAYYKVKIQDVTVTLTTEEVAALRLILLLGLYSTRPNYRHGVVFKTQRPFTMEGGEFGQQITYDRCAIMFSKLESRIRVKFRLIPKTVELVGTIGVIALVNKLSLILSPDGALELDPHAIPQPNSNFFERCSQGAITISPNTTLMWLNGNVWMAGCGTIAVHLNGDVESPRPNWVHELHSVTVPR